MEMELERYLRHIDEMYEYLSRMDKRKKPPTGLINELGHIIRDLRMSPLSRYHDDRFLRVNLDNCYRRLDASPTVGKTLDILSEVKSILFSTRRLDYESRLERRITELRDEVKRVAKIEEDLRKIRDTSLTTLESGEKKKENILKKFKSAEKKVFVIMPFDPMFDDVWKGGIERACNTEGFGCLRVDEVSLSTWISEDIKKYIEMADVVITDISGNNPNVMFELGWALANGKKPIVIRQGGDSDEVPFDIKDIRYISYINSWSGIERLNKDICKFIRSTTEDLSQKSNEKKKTKKSS